MANQAASPPAVMIMGPTGTGKTDLALRLVRQFPFEIISVDSALVYRDMDIGTAKPSAEILARVPHRLVNIRDPSEAYSAGDFRRDALAAMDEIEAAGRVPLLVGGTLLYFKALRQGLAHMPRPDPQLRARLDAEAREQGWPALHQRLARVDPAAARRIHPNDSQRLQRALEVWEQTGRPISELQNAGTQGGGRQSYLRIALVPGSRSVLNLNIEKRLKIMIKKGFADEVRRLYQRGDLHADLPAMRAVGYRQLWQHFTGEVDLDEAVRRATVATRRLAKRQMTWLRGEQPDAVFDPLSDDLDRQVTAFLTGELSFLAESL